MKFLSIVIFLFIGFQSFSMTEITKKNTNMATTNIESTNSDRKKRMNKKRKRKCKQWGKKSFAG